MCVCACVFQSEFTSRSRINTFNIIFHQERKESIHHLDLLFLPLEESGLTNILVQWHHSWENENTVVLTSHKMYVVGNNSINLNVLGASFQLKMFSVKYYLVLSNSFFKFIYLF